MEIYSLFSTYKITAFVIVKKLFTLSLLFSITCNKKKIIYRFFFSVLFAVYIDIESIMGIFRVNNVPSSPIIRAG